jgi:hypothetical protein
MQELRCRGFQSGVETSLKSVYIFSTFIAVPTTYLICFFYSNLFVQTGYTSIILLNNAMHALFKAIAATPVSLQKRKKQPRTINRRLKPYPSLMIPRYEACAIL